jgi:uncharacterized protein YndB with AHSA1/START domain
MLVTWALVAPLLAGAVGTSGPLRALRKELVVTASRPEVWRAWTTNEGAATFFAPRTDIDPVLGGHYEIYFFPDQPYGSRGAEGCRVHSLVPPRSLAFTWNAPPSLPLLRQAQVHTLVFVELDEAGPQATRVRLTHLGWGEGPDWDAAFAYFEKAWDIVLGRLKLRFETGPIDWQDPPRPTASLDPR